MREIKFRGWNQYWGCFHYATMAQLLDKDIGPDICELSNYSENPEVEQFIGLRDKNGREIYEGDIVHAIDNPTNVNTCIDVVVFKYGMFALRNMSSPLCDYDDKWLEVIGNIHENPELLA